MKNIIIVRGLDIYLTAWRRKINLTLLFILSLTAFFRFWQLKQRFIFSGETNNVLYTLSDLVANKRSPLLGLEATGYIHHLFHTPWYLYTIYPIYIFSKGEPLSFAFIHSLLGLMSVFFLYRIGVLISNKKLGYISAFIYAVTFKIILIDRSVWAIGLIPLFTIISIYLLFKSLSRGAVRYYFILGIWLGLGLSLHYQFIIVIIAALIATYLKDKYKCVYLVIPIIVSLLPLVIFDVRHSFFNSQGMLLMLKSFIYVNSPYSYQHYLYFSYPAIVLVLSYFLTKVKNEYLVLIAIFYLTVQAEIFFSYKSQPNYSQRLNLVNQILKHYNNGLQIYFKDKDSYEYRYLLFNKAQSKNLDTSKITIYEPWQPENGANIIIYSDIIIYK